jgi:hypothetical protein
VIRGGCPVFGDVRVTVRRVDSRSDANWRWDLVDDYGLVEAQSTDAHNTVDGGMYVSSSQAVARGLAALVRYERAQRRTADYLWPDTG